MFLLVDGKAHEVGRLDINLHVGMNGSMAFVESQKLNAEHAEFAILFHLMNL